MSESVVISPIPGFCIKSRVENPPNAGVKIFVNFAWDKHIPAPPDVPETDIQTAMSGQGDWFVPVLVSNLRENVDKAGNRALVVDAVYNTALKHRAITDQRFKTFLIQLAFQNIETQFSAVLSPNISTPNIASKGKLTPRSVQVPQTPYDSRSVQRKTLIQELPIAPVLANKGILKQGGASPEKTPIWSWSKIKSSTILITISVPDLSDRSKILTSTLDIEPRRLILHIPSLYRLDIDLSIPDAQADAPSENHFLTLKRARDFTVDEATAEWSIAEGVIFVYV